MAVNDLFQLTIAATLHGQNILNVLHYKQVAVDATPTQSLVSAFIVNMQPTWMANFSQDYVLQGYIAQKIAPAPITALFSLQVVATPGGLVEDALPTNTAFVIAKKTALAGRKYRGRLFLSGCGESYEEESILSAAGLLGLNALGAQLAGSLNIGGGPVFRPVLYHRSDKTSTDITTMPATVPMRNQRRRQVGRGI